MIFERVHAAPACSPVAILGPRRFVFLSGSQALLRGESLDYAISTTDIIRPDTFAAPEILCRSDMCR